MSKVTYSVVGRGPNSWGAGTGVHLMLRECGHKHKTIAAAEACERRLVRASCSHGTLAGMLCKDCLGRASASQWSADWFHSCIEDSAGNQAEF